MLSRCITIITVVYRGKQKKKKKTTKKPETKHNNPAIKDSSNLLKTWTPKSAFLHKVDNKSCRLFLKKRAKPTQLSGFLWPIYFDTFNQEGD